MIVRSVSRPGFLTDPRYVERGVQDAGRVSVTGFCALQGYVQTVDSLLSPACYVPVGAAFHCTGARLLVGSGIGLDDIGGLAPGIWTP